MFANRNDSCAFLQSSRIIHVSFDDLPELSEKRILFKNESRNVQIAEESHLHCS